MHLWCYSILIPLIDFRGRSAILGIWKQCYTQEKKRQTFLHPNYASLTAVKTTCFPLSGEESLQGQLRWFSRWVRMLVRGFKAPGVAKNRQRLSVHQQLVTKQHPVWRISDLIRERFSPRQLHFYSLNFVNQLETSVFPPVWEMFSPDPHIHFFFAWVFHVTVK